MKRVLIIVIIMLFIPWTTNAEVFKNGNSFEITRIDGLKDYFASNDYAEIMVGYRTRGSRVKCTPENGFRLQASLVDPDIPMKSKSIRGFNGQYDPYADEWYFGLDIPFEEKASYKLKVFLYCASDNAPCAEEYGQAAQVTESYYIEVWER